MRIKNLEQIANHGNTNARKLLLELLEVGMSSTDPYYAVKELIHLEGNKLILDGSRFEPCDDPNSGKEELDLSNSRIYVYGAGKGIQSVAVALEEILGDKLTGGEIILKYGDDNPLTRVNVTYAAHPVPDSNCVVGCKKIVDMINDSELTEDDIVFVITGNGVSSLLTMPAEGLSIDEVADLTRILQIEKGATTFDLNNVRNVVDQMKGGRITRMLKPAHIVHLLAWDANLITRVGKNGYYGLMKYNNWLHSLPDLATPELAKEVLIKYDVWDRVSENVRRHIENMTPEQLGMNQKEFEETNSRIFGLVPFNSMEKSIKERCKEINLPCYILSKESFLEATQSGKFFGGVAKAISNIDEPVKKPCVLLMTGEKIVAVGNNNGVGGRNQEFAVAAATIIRGFNNIVIASADTDGTDGPGGFFAEDAKQKGIGALAGGIVDGYTCDEAAAKGIDLNKALSTHATSKPLWELDCGIWTSQSISMVDITLAYIS